MLERPCADKQWARVPGHGQLPEGGLPEPGIISDQGLSEVVGYYWGNGIPPCRQTLTR